MGLHVLGVRHHSPACARRVTDAIRRLRPSYVLIEGPSDFNGRFDELRLGHQLPVALFTWYRAADRTFSCWTPFCRYSPEWAGMLAAQETGADVRFIDLPAWDKVFAGTRNRYADLKPQPERRDRSAEYVDKLCAQVGVDDMDSLWDHLFEQPMDSGELGHWLNQYFRALRGDAEAGDRDGPREAFMARCVAWALRDCQQRGGEVVVICGGWHQPVLERVQAGDSPEDAEFPAAPPPEMEEPETEAPEIKGPERKAPVWGTYLVPYSYKRLDAFTGYESGMPSPAWYDRLFDAGGDEAAEGMLLEVTGRLRAKKQPISTADLIACLSSARGLARLRGHAAMTRTDILDGIAVALLKDGLEQPLPWSRRGTLAAKTDPLLVEVIQTFSGAQEGRLAAGTPRPPLLFDVAERLQSADLEPGRAARGVRLELRKPEELEKSRLLHRLRVLGISGFERKSGPDSGISEELAEQWELHRTDTMESELIEASAWGANLEAAALRKLEEALLEARGLEEQVARLGDAVFVGVQGLAMRVITAAAEAVHREGDFRPVGGALARILGLWRGGVLLGAAGAQQLGTLLEALFDRGLWLVEGLSGPEQPADEKVVAGMLAMRDVARFGSGRFGPALELPAARAAGVMRRCAVSAEAPPAVRGAALGWLFTTGEGEGGSAEAAIRGAGRPETFGDFLYGLFGMAREEIATPALLAVMDGMIGEMDLQSFLVALPGLRLAFGWFPPRERRKLADAVVALHGGDARAAHRLLKMSVSPQEVVLGAQSERRARERAAQFGLADGQG